MPQHNSSPRTNVPAPISNEARFVTRLLKVTSTHRYPIGVFTVLAGLYLSGQTAIATGLLFGVGLFAVNHLVDNHMGGDQ